MKTKSINDMTKQRDMLCEWANEKPSKRFKYYCAVVNAFGNYWRNIYKHFGLQIGIDGINTKAELMELVNDAKMPESVYMRKEVTK